MIRAVNIRNVGDILQCLFRLSAFLIDRNNVRLMKDLHLVQPEWTSINVHVTLVYVIDANSPLFNMLDEGAFTVYARHMYFRHSIELNKAFQNAKSNVSRHNQTRVHHVVLEPELELF
ncbi:hypothetical protein THRCLA_21155 [Thraustotheca clavata]|uniref:Uncharacterized protein n=1 Tax=Thraustotheca clavata TaxID=74557 RepID=A0A1V9ZZK7_9STRA|nr:hypothetical protein THRCLA_21155 [Thraustotheca clavata]